MARFFRLRLRFFIKNRIDLLIDFLIDDGLEHLSFIFVLFGLLLADLISKALLQQA